MTMSHPNTGLDPLLSRFIIVSQVISDVKILCALKLSFYVTCSKFYNERFFDCSDINVTLKKQSKCNNGHYFNKSLNPIAPSTITFSHYITFT